MYSLSYGKFMVSSLLFLSCDLLPFLTHLLFTQSGCAFSDSTPSTVEDFSAWQSSCKAVILVCTLLALQYSSFMSKWFSLLYSLLPNYISWFSFDESLIIQAGFRIEKYFSNSFTNIPYSKDSLNMLKSVTIIT